jgi:hypothetical protein
MKHLLILLLMFFSINAFCQTYIYVEPNPSLEKEKKDKETYFQDLMQNVQNAKLACLKRCGPYAADANDPKDPCTLPGVTNKCICDCNTLYGNKLKNLEQQEEAWRIDIARREKNYENQQKQKQALNNQIQANSNPLTNSSSTNDNITSTPYQHSEVNTSATNAKQQKNEAIINAGNVLIDAAEDIYSTIQANKQRKEDYWNSLTREEQQAAIEARRRADSIKLANKEAKRQQEADVLAHVKKFSIGIYGAIEDRTFVTEGGKYYDTYTANNVVGKIFADYAQKNGYNLGITFEWASDPTGGGRKSRGLLLSTGLYYVRYSAPMAVNMATNAEDDSIGVLKFQSIRVPLTLNYRLFRWGATTGGVYFLFGFKGDYIFSTTINKIKPASNSSGYAGYFKNYIQTSENVSKDFQKFEYGGVVGIRANLSRNIYLQLQYDYLGGTVKVLKGDNYDSFKEKQKTTVGIGICF